MFGAYIGVQKYNKDNNIRELSTINDAGGRWVEMERNEIFGRTILRFILRGGGVQKLFE